MSVTRRREFLLLACRASVGVGSAALLAACSSPGSPSPAATTAPAAQPTQAAKPAAPTPAAPTPAAAQAPTTAPAANPTGDINLYVGGDVNIRDLWQNADLNGGDPPL